MAGVEGIVDALFTLGEAGDAALLPDGGERISPSGDQLMAV